MAIALLIWATALFFVHSMPLKRQGIYEWRMEDTLLSLLNKRKADKTEMPTNDESTKKLIYPAELLEHIRILPENDSDNSTLHYHSFMKEGDVSKLLTEATKAGSLTIMLKRETEARAADRWMRVDSFDGEEWVAIFSDVLSCPTITNQPLPPDGNFDEWGERLNLGFQQALMDYPMLRRISSIHADVTYEPEEVNKLHHECLNVKPAATHNQVALNGLNKLINACEQALRYGAGLELLSD